ncbi:hypothetical protein OPQ81_002952 [Rhizoctonia solani]|nr:hypothetical protein OPQ81_002952 [Rhizoctonia solani]
MAALSVFGGENAYIPMRAGPPQPQVLELHFKCAATPLPLSADTHQSGHSLRIKLDNPHPENPFRTSELITGQLMIYAKPNTKRLVVPRLSLRVYFESRTLFTGLQRKKSGALNQKIQKVKSTVAQDYENVMKHEVHRGVVPTGNLTLSWDPQSSLGAVLEPGNEHSRVSLPFSFTTPRRMTVTEYNDYSGAPRNLCYVPHCPPPTFRDSPVGSVQWVIEAVMYLALRVQEEKDEMMLLQPTDQRVLMRLVFPVMPAPEDVASLRKEPFFGNNLESELFGSRRLSREEVGMGKKALIATSKGGNWETYVKEIAVLERYNVQSEVYVNSGSRLSTDAPTFPLILFLKHTSTRAGSFPSFLCSSKPKVLHLIRAKVALRCTTSTRGGKEVKPHVRNVMITQHEIQFDSSSSSSAPGVIVPSGDAAPLEIDLTFDVQSEEMHLASGKQASVPAKNLTPSFRTPNIEHEHYTTVSLIFEEDKVERIPTQFPVQVVPGSTENQPAPFQDTLPEYTTS